MVLYHGYCTSPAHAYEINSPASNMPSIVEASSGGQLEDKNQYMVVIMIVWSESWCCFPEFCKV